MTRGITEQAADAAIDTACRVLRLPTIRARFAEAADKAEHDQLTYRGFLAELFMAECEDRDHRRVSRRGESHPPPLSGPDVTVSRHPAPTVRSAVNVTSCQWAKRRGWCW